MENAAMLVTKLFKDTARGVRFVISLRGMTGKGAQYFSERKKRTPDTALVMRRP
jgi:hypothetical protein